MTKSVQIRMQYAVSLLGTMALFLSLVSCAPDESASQNGTQISEEISGTLDSVKYYTLGSEADAEVVEILPGLCLMGGGSDNDEALRWMIRRSGGGDFFVIRASGSDGYNRYIYEELGGVDSVTTLVIDSREGAQSQAIADWLLSAEGVFIAGGDQSEYTRLWEGSRLAQVLNQLINEKRIPFGGTSAGMAILSTYTYLPQREGVLSSEALSDPYHPNMETIRRSWLHVPMPANTISDTHFSERERLGRTLTFLARIVTDNELAPASVRAISCDEGCAVCIDETGLARVFGRFPQRRDFAFFFSCLSRPEICEPLAPLSWEQGVLVERIAGTRNGENQFDLNTWLGHPDSQLTLSVDTGQISADIMTPN